METQLGYDQFIDSKKKEKDRKIDKSTSTIISSPCCHINNKKKNVTTKRHELVSYNELPDYMKDNEFILSYYRANWPIKEALFSVFRWHNETLNVWTHLIGFVVFVGLTMSNLMQVPQVADLVGFLTRSYTGVDANFSIPSKNLYSGPGNLIGLQNITTPDMDISAVITPVTRWPFLVFLAGSMFCLFSSSVCHLFSCHSHPLNLLLLRIDYAGITVMIITSFFPPIFYIFQCDPRWQFIYLGGITAMGIFTIVTLLSPLLSTAKFRVFRAMLFVSMGFFGIFPAVHAMIVNWNNPRRAVTLMYEAAMAFFYLTGTMFYVTRIPERWKPGWFDLAGHSHQIFHVFVVLGALAHYGATQLFLEWRDRVGCEINI
ncbi:hypothetical protein ACFE04_010031 [Oxalis oulophora]